VNQFSSYFIIGEAFSAFGDWAIHLHLKQGDSLSETALCGRTWTNKHNTRRFGERKHDSNPSTQLAEGVSICSACEKMRLDETPEYLFGVGLEKLMLKDGVPTWVVQPVEHFHAKDYEDARAKALAINSEDDIRIIEVARVIGYFVNDTKGNNLSV
jgi:hypothetical protein